MFKRSPLGVHLNIRLPDEGAWAWLRLIMWNNALMKTYLFIVDNYSTFSNTRLEWQRCVYVPKWVRSSSYYVENQTSEKSLWSESVWNEIPIDLRTSLKWDCVIQQAMQNSHTWQRLDQYGTGNALLCIRWSSLSTITRPNIRFSTTRRRQVCFTHLRTCLAPVHVS